MSGSRTVRKLAVAVSLLPLLAACGTEAASHSAGDGKAPAGPSGQLDVPADAGADLKKQYLMENAIASCMKKQGFTYTPEPPVDPASSWAHDGADYELTKKFRQKYGFGYSAAAVYPDDPQVPGSKAATKPSANAEYVATLTPAQKTAYDKAMGGPRTRRPAKRTGPVARERPTRRLTAPHRPKNGAPQLRPGTRRTRRHSTVIRSWSAWRSRTPRA